MCSAQASDITTISNRSSSTESLVNEQQVLVVDLKATVEELKKENDGKQEDLDQLCILFCASCTGVWYVTNITA